MGDIVRNTLKKKERLSSESSLSRLFANGHYGTSDCIRYCFRAENSLSYNRIVVSVPKRFFKRAVKRNLLKRRIREAYRIGKMLLPVDTEKGGTDILFIYNTKEIMDATSVDNAVKTALINIADRIAQAKASSVNESES